MLEAIDTSIILCSPEGEANIGGAARAMMCFGAERLILVNPRCQLTSTAYNWACHAHHILDSCRQVDALAEAIEDCNVVLGFTRRWGKRRHKLYSLEKIHAELEAHPQPGKVALVFGNEESGLSNEELEACQRLVTIPTQGSLNLSHSVSLALYELFGRQRPIPGAYAKKLADAQRRKLMMQAIGQYLQALGEPPQRGASSLEELGKLADIFDRAQLEEWEVNYLAGMFKHLYVKFQNLSHLQES